MQNAWWDNKAEELKQLAVRNYYNLSTMSLKIFGRAANCNQQQFLAEFTAAYAGVIG